MTSLITARSVFQALKMSLEPLTHRFEIAGSVRRGKPEVGDLEVLCIPKCASLFGQGEDFRDAPLWKKLDEWLARERITKTEPPRWGTKYRQFWYAVKCLEQPDKTAIYMELVKVDLFTAHRENWGIQMLIRTGPADFSKHIVTKLLKAGLPVRNGWVRSGNNTVFTPSEESVFEILQMAYIEPERRAAP